MRTKSSIKNILVSTAMAIIAVVIGFISQRIFIESLGLEYLGINGLFTNIISMLGIVEIGLGSAIIYHLYRPLIELDKARIKSLLEFYKKGYRVIAGIVTVIGFIIMLFLGNIVGEVKISENIYFIYLLFLADVVLSYLLAYKRSILYADQRSYIINLVHIFYTVIVNGLQIAILLTTKDFYLYLFIKVIMHTVENIVIATIVNIRYPYINDTTAVQLDRLTKDDVYQKIKALFIHKIAAFVVFGTDNIVIAIFFGIKTVGLFTNYYLIISAINLLVDQIFMAITASIGNLLAVSNSKKSFDTYKRVRFVNFWLASISSIGLLVSADQFVTVWLGKEFILPFGVLVALTINLYLESIRSATSSFKEAAGIFHQDRHVPIIESAVNIVFSIVLLQFFGLAGVFMGTICSNLVLHLFSYPKYVYTQLFKRSYKNYYLEFIEYLTIALTTGAITFALSRAITVHGALQQLIVDVLLSVAVPSIIFYLIYRKSDEFAYFKELTIKIVRKVKRVIF
ncbi:MAG: hypothetical protein JWN75_485 [Candidatus Saccharibacteria bacterium]|nr:hypothetical protein [Candidatus Saccharibacteria bacterium]